MGAAINVGECLVRIAIDSKEWSRTVQITTGEIHLPAEILDK
jgi:hypothetical protein